MDQAAGRTALAWIVGLLNRAGIPFQVVGGVAAAAYGARRDLGDIDLSVPAAHLPSLMRLAGPDRIIKEPWRHRDEAWDLILMALEHGGQRIEVGVADAARYRERASGAWHDASIDVGTSMPRVVWGIEVPVMPRAQLIDCKRRLDREVDRRDLAEMAEPAVTTSPKP